MRKANGSSIFKRKKGKFRKLANKTEGNEILHPEENNKQAEEPEDKNEAIRCKYSSGKDSNGLEKCTGCGVGYRYSFTFSYITIQFHLKKLIYLEFL